MRVLPPPREAVARTSLIAERLDVFTERGNVVGAEHVSDEEVAGGPQEVRHVLAIVRHEEGAPHVERAAAAVREIHALGIVQRAPVVERAEAGFPGHEVDRLAANTADPASVEESGGRLELVDEPLPRLVIELDHAARAVVARDDVERPLAPAIRERAALAQPERETSEAVGCVQGTLQTPGVEQRRERLAVIPIEVDRREGHDASLHDLRGWTTSPGCLLSGSSRPAASAG